MERKRSTQTRDGVRWFFTTFTSTSSSVATHELNCRSSVKILNLKIVLDWFCGAISPMAKCWTTKAGHARCGRRLATVSGFSEGVAPEGTPQRLCPHSPVPSKNDGWPTTKSNALLSSTMQQGGTKQSEAIQRSDAHDRK